MKSQFFQGRLVIVSLLLFAHTILSQAQPGGWAVNPPQFQYNMTVVAQLKVNGVPNHALGNHLAVFSRGQIRGYATATGVNGQAYYFLSIYANTYQGDTLYFRSFLGADHKVYESTDTLIFRHQRAVGTIGTPLQVNLFLGSRPLIYSLSEVNYVVNSCPDVADVQASDNQDSERNGLTYSLVGGADAAKFSIGPQTGIVSWFNFAPGLLPPGDANGDNKYQVSVKVTDSSGQFDIQYLTVNIVSETTLPPLVCPPNLFLQTSADGLGDCGATTGQARMYALNPCALYNVSYQLSGATIGSDMGQVPFSQSFNTGLTTVLYSRNGGGGSQCSFMVTVTDNELPLINCPPNLIVGTTATPPCAAIVHDIDAVFSDNCPGVLLNYSLSGERSGSGSGQVSGQIFPEGVTQVAFSAMDAVGQSATCSFSITVQDVIPPSAICKNTTVQLNQNGVATISSTDVDNGSADDCGIASRYVSPNTFTCANVGANTVTLTVTDVHNNSADCTATVTVEALSLGNLVYNDLNRNGVFDGLDNGINGVLCNLYLDNGNGVLDIGDNAPIGAFTTTTLNNQPGSYLFTRLCPNNYIVEIAPVNFLPGGPLYDNNQMVSMVSSPVGGAPDPNNDVDNDDNGDPIAGFGIASSAITLVLNLEPDNDSDTDKNTNLSLDFGFKVPASVSIDDVSMAEGTAGGTTAFNFTVTRTDNNDAFNLTVNTNNGTAVSTSDYAAISGGTIGFTAGGSLTATITVLVNHDATVEANETFTVHISDPTGTVAISDASGLGTINNDDSAVVTLSGSTVQNEGAAFTFTATLNNPVQSGFSVAYTANDGTATVSDNDYTDNDGTIIFSGTAGESKSITVQTTNDNKVELNENFTVTLGTITGAPAGVNTTGSPQTGTINNDDAATVSIAANVNSLEAVTPQAFSITLSSPVDAPVTVQFSTSNGTATTSDNDFTGIFGQTVTFATGTTIAQVVNVAIVNDNKVEADETFDVAIANLSAGGRNVSLGATSRTGTILNDDVAIVTLFGGIAQNEGNTGVTSYVFTATLNNPVQGGFLANYSTNDGTATTANNDYMDNDGPPLSFSGTAGEVKTFIVLVNGDLNIEANESFQTAINSLSGVINPSAITISGSPQIATINNDEQDWGDAPVASQSGLVGSYPTLSANNGARHAATLGGLHLGPTIDGDLDGQANATATGDGSDEDGVTLPGGIVTNNNTNLTINASGTGLLNAWVDFNHDGDWADAGEQVFVNQAVVAGNNALSFAVPGSASLGVSFARFRLSSAPNLSFDGAATDGEVEDYAVNIVSTQFSINDPMVNEGNLGTSNLVFTVSRTVNSNACSVSYAITGGTATSADNDYQPLAAGTVNFTVGGALTAFITVVVNGDNKVELNETVDITLSNPVNGSIQDGSGTGTITNDDAATVSISGQAVVEGDVNTNIPLAFTLTLSNPSDAPVVLSYSTIDGSATSTNNDYQSTTGTTTFAPGQGSKTVLVTVNGDCSMEPNETFLLRLSNLVNNGRNVMLSGGGATLDGGGTINNDDALPIITCPASISKNVDPGVCSATVLLPLPGTSSICGTPLLEFRYRIVDKFNVPIGPFSAFAPAANNTIVFSKNRYEIEWRITDGSGNSVCSYYLTVIDNQPPAIVCPPNQNIPANTSCSGTVGAWAPVFLSDNCTPVGAILVTQTPPASTVLSGHNAGALVTLTADDGGNTASCSFTVTLKDQTPPLAKCKNATVSLGSNGTVTVLPSVVNNGSTDNCSFTLTLTPNTFTCATLGIKTVTLQATDAGGNTATCTARVTVSDLSPPVASCNNPTIYLDNTGRATLTVAHVNNGSSDACGISSMSLSQTLFNCSELNGSTNVTLSLTDVNGNTASCLSHVMVRDALAPTAVCEDVTVKLGSNGTVLVYGATLAVNSFDNCSVWSYSPVVKIYKTVNIGLNYLPITVKDWSGNATTCVSEVTVLPFSISTDFTNGNGGGNTDWKQGNSALFDIDIFPNPTDSEATVAFELPVEQVFTIQVFDVTGRTVYHREDQGFVGKNRQLLTLVGMATGVYVVDFESEGLKVQKRLMVRQK